MRLIAPPQQLIEISSPRRPGIAGHVDFIARELHAFARQTGALCAKRIATDGERQFSARCHDTMPRQTHRRRRILEDRTDQTRATRQPRNLCDRAVTRNPAPRNTPNGFIDGQVGIGIGGFGFFHTKLQQISRFSRDQLTDVPAASGLAKVTNLAVFSEIGIRVAKRHLNDARGRTQPRAPERKSNVSFHR
jgi:hypothetical protein